LAAASCPLLIVSLFSNPGSLKFTFASNHPGDKKLPFASISLIPSLFLSLF
jgi:hypothetical protein